MVTDTKTRSAGQAGGLARLWQSRWLSAAVGLGAAALTGFLVALVMPYGPATSTEALIVLATGLLTGLIAGLALRTRWAIVLAPLAYVAALEIGRMGAVGPTVDLPVFNEVYGLLALVLGRGFHALVGLLPMMLGAGWGLRLARRLSPEAEARTGGRRWTLALGALFILALVVLILLPASTPPILGADGQPLPGSIAELTTVNLGGQEQAVMIRGHSQDNPVLLYLSGGPGQSDLPYVRVLLNDLEEDFIVVGWDQRGTGKSYAALDPAATLTLDQMVADTVALTNYLRQRFDEEKVYLLGESWGTTLGVLAVQRNPELYHAFLGSGQMVSQRVTDQRLYQDVLDLAAEHGDQQVIERMQAYGQPPYEAVPYANAYVMGFYDALYQPYTPPQAYIERGTAAGLGPWGMLGSEYNFVEKVNVLRGLIDMFSILYPQLQQIDFRQDVPRLEVPVYILDGEAEATARRDLALEWFELLQAPEKQIFTFENAGHSVAFEQFEALHEILTEEILPETYATP